MARYKIVFHIGSSIGLKTHADKGTIDLDQHQLVVSGKFSQASIALSAISSANLIKLGGIGTMIKVESEDETVFLSVIRFMIGQFAMTNYFATRRLHKALNKALGEVSA